MKYKYTRHGDVLAVKLSGIFSIQEALENFDILLQYCRFMQVGKVALDYRSVKAMPTHTLLYLFEFGLDDMYRKFVIECKRCLLFATVQDDTTLKDQHMPQLQADRLAFRPKDFLHLEDALNWLNSRHPPLPKEVGARAGSVK